MLEGLALVNAMHITASVFINDDERGLHHDYEVSGPSLAPHYPDPWSPPHSYRCGAFEASGDGSRNAISLTETRLWTVGTDFDGEFDASGQTSAC